MDLTPHSNSSLTSQAASLRAEILNEVDVLRTTLKLMGAKVRPETELSLRGLNTSGVPALERTLAEVRNFRELCQESVQPEGIAKNDRQLLWNTLRKLKAVPPSDIIDKIEDQDVIEVYNTQFIQIFRNLNYFDISSYTLVEVFTHQWDELYERENPNIGQQMMNVALSVISGKARATFPCGVDSHVLKERFSEEQLRLNMIPGYVSPLFDRDHQLVGAIFTSKVEILADQSVADKKPAPQAERLRLVPETEA